MNTLQFRQYSVAHQLGLVRGLLVVEIYNIKKDNNQILVEYCDADDRIKMFPLDKQEFISAIEKRNQAVYISCEFKKEIKQFVLVSRLMGEYLGLKVIKDLTKVSPCELETSYQKSLILANSVQYKPLIEQKAITVNWLAYEELVTGIKNLRCKTFHTRYSDTFNKKRKTISELEKQMMYAYENIHYADIECAMERIESIAPILPLKFIEHARRLYLEMIKNWHIVRVEIPNQFLSRVIFYINHFELAPFTLSSDSNWNNVKNALSYF